MYTFAEKNNKQQISESSGLNSFGKTQLKPPKLGNFLQRKCACNGSHNGSGECEECKKKKLSLQRKEANSLQTKLTINTPGDAYEKEADAMADKVMRMSIPENVNLKHNEEQGIQRKESCNNDNLSTAPQIVNAVLNSAGKPLDEETRSFMEPRFGYDFSNVQIHNDSLAYQSSVNINALAYTHGNHVVFGATKYNPDSKGGKRLLAHELTHVIQQNKASNNLVQKQGMDDVEEESAREGERFREARRRDLSKAIDSMRFKKVRVDCPKSTKVKLLKILTEMRTKVAKNQKCLDFFKQKFKIIPDILLDPKRKPSITFEPTLKASGRTRCPEPAVLIGDICTSPHLERVIMHELTHYTQCLVTGVPSTEELAVEGENICMGTAQEAVDRVRKAKEKDK